MNIGDIAAKATSLLQGEPARFIFYGAALVVWAVVGIANLAGIVRFGPSISLTDALTDATLAGAALTEMVRRFVYSPNTVIAIAGPQAQPAAADGDTE
jgi:hypothetical protein